MRSTKGDCSLKASTKRVLIRSANPQRRGLFFPGRVSYLYGAHLSGFYLWANASPAHTAVEKDGGINQGELVIICTCALSQSSDLCSSSHCSILIYHEKKAGSSASTQFDPTCTQQKARPFCFTSDKSLCTLTTAEKG